MKPAVLRPARNAGLSLLEVLVVAGGIAVIAAVGMVSTGNVMSRVTERKLVQDVETINQAIKIYEVSGGNMDWMLSHPTWVLKMLKKHAANDDVKVGLSSNLIDPRLNYEAMTPYAIEHSDDARAVWDPTKKRFAVIHDNSIEGIKIGRFFLSDAEGTGESPILEYIVDNFVGDGRTKSAYDYAANGNWVWDYQDRTSSGGSGPTEVLLNPGLASTPAGAPPGTTQLDPPLFSIAGGEYPLTSYDLSLTLTNPNDPSVSEIYYSTNLGSWSYYDGTPIVVTAGVRVSAVAATTDLANWTSSDLSQEIYTTTPEQLELAVTVPSSMTYEEAGGSMENGGTGAALKGPGSITLANAGDIPSSYINSLRMKVMWTLDGTDPVALGDLEYQQGISWPPANLFLADPFSGGFPGQNFNIGLGAWGSQNTLPVQAYAKSANPEVFTSSSVASDTIAISKSTLRGPQISNVFKTVTLTKLVAFGDMPVGARVVYTEDGSFPGDSNGEPVGGTEYSGPFLINTNTHPHCGNFNIIAKVFGPSGYGHWFNPSPSVTKLVEIPPDPGTPERFGYNFSQSDISNYAVLALKKLETKDRAKVYGNVGVGPDGKRKTDNLALNGSYDVDPLSQIEKDNAKDFDGAGVSPTSVDLNQAVLDAVTLSAEAAALTPTQTFNKIELHTTINATVSNSVNVIQIKEIKLEKERVLTLYGGTGDWFILNVTDKIAIKDGSIRTSGGVPQSHVVINYINSSDINMEGDGSIQGTLLAPYAKVVIKDEVTVEGTVVMGKDSRLEKDAVVSGTGNTYAFQCTADGEAVGGATTLAAPDFSIPGATYPVNDFNLSLKLFDPNEAGAGTIFYALNGGAWTKYTGASISVSPAMTVDAYVETSDPGRWNSSAQESNTYSADLPQLDEPAIATSASKFDAGANTTVTVTITHTNGALGTVKYRLAGGMWTTYAGAFVLNSTSYTAMDAEIEAQVVAVDQTAYANSDIVNETVLKLNPTPLDKPEIILSEGTTSDPDGTTVTLVDPNPPGSSQTKFVIVPLPSSLGCDIIHGNGFPVGTFTIYSAPVEIASGTYPGGFAVIAFSDSLTTAWIDSTYVVGYDESDLEGLRGGHFDVDTTSGAKYTSVWSSWPGGGSTDQHTHEYDNKNDTAVVDMFVMDGSHRTVSGNVGASDHFKIIVVNANLSPYAHIAINQNPSTSAPYITTYDDTAFASLPTYSLDGNGTTTKLTKLSILFDEDAIVNAGLLPSNTGDVKGNTPGKAGEWRNGALTVQIVKVDSSGNPIGGALDTAKSNGNHGVARPTGMLHEMTIFWHWPGDSYHQSSNLYVPATQSTIVSELDDAEEPLCN